MKKYNALAKTFDPIKSAGVNGAVDKTKAVWVKASVALEANLEAVELPSSLSDPL